MQHQSNEKYRELRLRKSKTGVMMKTPDPGPEIRHRKLEGQEGQISKMVLESMTALGIDSLQMGNRTYRKNEQGEVVESRKIRKKRKKK